MPDKRFPSENPLRRTFLAAPFSQHAFYPTDNTRHPLSSAGDDERFQYATCPQCSSDRARLTKQVVESWKLFGILCPFCGYEDADVSDH